MAEDLSGVKGEEFMLVVVVVVEFWRGDGVRGMRPPAVRVVKSPRWDLRGVDTRVAILIDVGWLSCIDVGYGDLWRASLNERAPRDSSQRLLGFFFGDFVSDICRGVMFDRPRSRRTAQGSNGATRLLESDEI